nr:PepSY domain-containing protein [uncultured Bacillus sp.]
MNKKLIIGALGMAIIFGGALAAGAAEDPSSPKEILKNGQNRITLEEAKKIALKEADGRVESVEMEKGLNRVVYEVEIEKGNTDYDVYIDASTGKVVSVKKENRLDDDRYNDIGTVDGQVFKNETGVSESDQTISEDKAVNIAEKAVNGKVYELELEHDDGILAYKMELQTTNGRIDVEVDGTTGEILETERDD